MIRPLRSCLFSILSLVCLISITVPPAFADTYDALKKRAENYFAEGSFKRAHDLYKQANEGSVPAEEKRWVAFRLADTQWRQEAATNNPDPGNTEEARTALDHMVRDIAKDKDKDRVWAETMESLGDFWWLRRNSKNWSASWRHYQQALDWWAGAKDIELARERYLRMAWNMASPPWRDRWYVYGNYGNQLPMDMIENLLKIAVKDEDRHRTHYLFALGTRHQGGWDHVRRTTHAFEEALKAGKASDWYDDALFQYADWLASYGDIVIRKKGGATERKQNFKKALVYYRRLVNEFEKGETRYYEDARRRIEQITHPSLNVSVSNIFLPTSEIQAHMNWRNVGAIQFTLHAVDLTQDMALDGNASEYQAYNHIELDDARKVMSWTEDTGDEGEHFPGSRTVQLKQKLETGAYVLTAASGSLKARELILVTDAALLMKSSPKQTLLYFADSAEGGPLADAQVRLYEKYRDGRKWKWRSHSGRTNGEGLALFKLDAEANAGMFATARSGKRQAFAHSRNHYSSRRDGQWKLYVTTDRPAYRPQETAHWKLTARLYDDATYSTPSGDQIVYEITDPRGTKLKSGDTRLNAFGSAWGDLELSENIPLGPYTINFWTQDRKKHIGSATLFRLEEYKLPEFKVHIKTPEENGRRKVFLSGQTVEVEIGAEYYFGGPVNNAEVEVLVYQKTFQPWWRPEPRYPWYYQDMYSPPRHWGSGNQIKREVLKTDANGRAHLKFETPANGQNAEYRIEARVTDSSRREVRGSGTVRVSPQKFFAYLNADHQVITPNEPVTLRIKTLDANQQGLITTGTLRITRDFWYEIWISPEGKEVSGAELKSLKADSAIWPPVPPFPDRPGWRLKFRGYQHDEIKTQTVTTDEKGAAEIRFTPPQEGYYRFAYQHEDEETPPVTAETTVWAATNRTTQLGFHTGGLRLIVDKDTFEAGQKAPVMIATEASNRWVLFSVESEHVTRYQLVHIPGTVKLVMLDINEEHVPNVFLQGTMIHDHQVYRDTQQVIVPPTQNFLTVEVRADKEQYGPRDTGRLTVTTKDHAGRPVSAEVSLGLVDESVYAIQKDLALDPRPFFFGEKRQHRVQTSSTFQVKRYIALVENDEGALVDRTIQERLDARNGDAAGTLNSYKARALKKEGFAAGKSVARQSAAAPMAQMGALSMADNAMPAEEAESLEARSEIAGGGAGGDAPAVQVRSDFRTTVFWQPDVQTGRDGTAQVAVTFPDSLTEWRATARAATTANRFGQATSTVHTQKPLIVRLQSPRFFVVGDEVTLSANLNNNTDRELLLKPTLRANNLEILGSPSGDLPPVTAPANGETRVDWRVRVMAPGDVRIQMSAAGDVHSDAMEKTLVAHEHGIEKFLAQSGKMTGDTLTASVTLPQARQVGSTRMQVQVTPSLAVTLLDSLPYLIDFPYGCTEQTLSRFLPTVLAANTLKGLGLKPADVLGRVFGGIDSANAEHTHRGGPRDLEQLSGMVDKGLERLADFQHSDGGWGWWKQGPSDPFMTAYVLWGLSLAVEAGETVNTNLLDRAYGYLTRVLVEAENNFALQAWELHATTAYRVALRKQQASKFEVTAFDNLWKNRSRLNAYTRALLALGAHHMGRADEARTLVRNLENGVIEDNDPASSTIQRGENPVSGETPGTAHWGEDGIFYRWSDGGVEATAFVLRALLTIDPKHRLVAPTVNWLIKNRRGAHWSNTRDTAIVLMSLTQYLKTSGELESDAAYEVRLNGATVAQEKVTDVLRAPSTFAVDAKLIRDGENKLELIRTSGKGPLYYSLQAAFFSLEEPITAAGNEIFVRRQYYRLAGRPTLLKGYVYDRVPLGDGDHILSGDRVQAVLTIEAKNHYEYLVFEDLKPGGFEAVQVKSGAPVYARELKRRGVEEHLSEEQDRRVEGNTSGRMQARTGIVPPHPGNGGEASIHTGRQRQVYQELRDRKVALFVDKLPQGVWEIQYDLRAEVPGEFHALPLTGHAMYIPEIRANGREIRVTVEDK
ncbi:MAG: alpha-2-macroglobulin [Nitrospina sp.]|nr:alpha-2-macroglobulin [Nitrospina sp.]